MFFIYNIGGEEHFQGNEKVPTRTKSETSLPHGATDDDSSGK
jgi:hypothetical protein